MTFEETHVLMASYLERKKPTVKEDQVLTVLLTHCIIYTLHRIHFYIAKNEKIYKMYHTIRIC